MSLSSNHPDLDTVVRQCTNHLTTRNGCNYELRESRRFLMVGREEHYAVVSFPIYIDGLLTYMSLLVVRIAEVNTLALALPCSVLIPVDSWSDAVNILAERELPYTSLAGSAYEFRICREFHTVIPVKSWEAKATGQAELVLAPYRFLIKGPQLPSAYISRQALNWLNHLKIIAIC